MQGEETKSSDFAARIRALGAPERLPEKADPPGSPGSPATLEKPSESSPRVSSSSPAAPGSPAAPAIVEEWLYDWEGFKPHKKHLEFVRNRVDPKSIDHIPWGFKKGCACHDCMLQRERARRSGGSAPAVDQAKDPILSSILSEKFCGRILNLPNRGMELYARIRQAPQEAIDLWKTDEEELRYYGQVGKQLADYYLSLPDFKHKTALLFGISYSLEFGEKITAMILIMRAQGRNA